MTRDDKDFLIIVGKLTIGAILLFPLVMCASSCDDQAEQHAKELGCADGQSVYSVKSTSRNGVRGYLIIGKI